MSLDELALAAAADLRATTERDTDIDRMLRRLHRARARRRVAWAAATAAVLALVLALATSTWNRGRALPARPPTPSTHEVLLVNSAKGLTAVGGAVAHLPPALPSVATDNYPVAFSPDGTELAYGWWSPDGTGQVSIMDLATGTTRRLAACRWCMTAWSADGRVLLVLVTERHVQAVDIATGTARDIPLPKGWTVFYADLNRDGRVVMSGVVDGQEALFGIDLAGGRPSVIQQLGTTGVPIDLRWSPDGTSIAYLFEQGWVFSGTHHNGPVSVRLVNADGSGARTLASLVTAMSITSYDVEHATVVRLRSHASVPYWSSAVRTSSAARDRDCGRGVPARSSGAARPPT
jgi:hypothetical protein